MLSNLLPHFLFEKYFTSLENERLKKNLETQSRQGNQQSHISADGSKGLSKQFVVQHASESGLIDSLKEEAELLRLENEKLKQTFMKGRTTLPLNYNSNSTYSRRSNHSTTNLPSVAPTANHAIIMSSHYSNDSDAIDSAYIETDIETYS